MNLQDLIKEKKEAGFYIISNAGNKIEFSDGTTYAKDFRTGLYHKVKNFIL